MPVTNSCITAIKTIKKIKKIENKETSIIIRGLKGFIVNQACNATNGRSLEITSTVLLVHKILVLRVLKFSPPTKQPSC